MTDMPARPRFKRKQYLVSAKFQLKYAGIIVVFMFLTAFFCSYVIYYTSVISLGEKLASVYPQGQLVNIVNKVNLKILISMVLMSPLVIVGGILLSHKIAGPIFRMERFLGSMAKGDFGSRLTLRKGDEMVNLADGINGVCESVKKSIATEKELLNRIASDVGVLRSKTEDTVIVDRLENEIMDLLKEIGRYKI